MPYNQKLYVALQYGGRLWSTSPISEFEKKISLGVRCALYGYGTLGKVILRKKVSPESEFSD